MKTEVASIQTIREMFGYLRRYRNEVFVLKIEDTILGLPLFPMLMRDIVLLHQTGIRIVLVPGAKKSIDTVLKKYGIRTRTHHGIRITTPDSMPMVKLGLSNVSNTLLSLLAENEAHGVMGNWVRARAMGVKDGVDFKQTGHVEKVNSILIKGMLDDHLIPIVSNIGWNTVGMEYNLNSSELAVAVAKSLNASKLFFVGEATGIQVVEGCPFVEPSEMDSGFFSNLDREEGEILLKDYSEILGKPARDLLALALLALAGGVERVHIINGAKDGILLQEVFSSTGRGTMLYLDDYDHIHPAQISDIPEMLRIMQPYVDDGVLIQRTAEDLSRELERFTVYQVDDVLCGCGALSPIDKNVAELYALAVDSSYSGRGTGRKIVSFLLEKARKSHIKKVFLLTTQTSDFFMRLGFKEVPVSTLPADRQRTWNRTRNSRVFLKTI